MDSKELITAIETTAKREGIFLSDNYREEHVLYHTSLNALKGLFWREIDIGNFLRTTGVKFAILRSHLDTKRNDEVLGDWISVGIFSMMGAPIKRFEHETIGLEINSI